MKHNWEYIRLGEICSVIGGSTPKTDIPEYWNGEYNWYTPAELDDKKYYRHSVRKITDEAVKSCGLTLMPAGTVLLSSRAPIGKVGIILEEAYCNQGFKNLVCSSAIFNEYLYYTLLYFNEEIKEKGKGSTFKEISKTVTESIKIPVPPIDVQKHIATELDKLNEMIATRKEQLKVLDNLAQSLFYSTFGDPITNPKGWPQKFFSRCFRLNSGEGLSAKDIKTGPYPVYGGNGIIGHHNFSNLGGINLIIGRVGALCGNVRLVSGDIFVTDNAFVVYLLHDFNHTFALHLLTILNLRKYAKAVAQPVISNLSLKNIPLILPPLHLQQQFATQVEAIEKQKEMVEASIAELQTLLDSRMDYWFN